MTKPTKPTILNLTQHAATPEQVAAGVIDLQGDDTVGPVAVLRMELTFNEKPSIEDLHRRADRLLDLVIAADFELDADVDAVMIGGAPYFMPVLQEILMDHRYKVVYAFSKRESEETVNPDGSVTKRNVFRHAGFVQGSTGFYGQTRKSNKIDDMDEINEIDNINEIMNNEINEFDEIDKILRKPSITGLSYLEQKMLSISHLMRRMQRIQRMQGR